MAPVREQLLVEELLRDPHGLFAELRRDAPVWQLPGQPVHLVATWDLVAEATSRVEDFSNHFRYLLHTTEDGTLAALETGPTGPDVFAGADPPMHVEHRRVFASELGPQHVAALDPHVTAITDELLSHMLAAGRADAAAGLAQPLPMRVVADHVIGFRGADLERVRRWVFAGSRIAGGCLKLDEIVAAAADVAEMPEWVASQLDAALADHNRGGLLDAAARAVTEGHLTHQEAAFTLMVLVGAGAETSTSLIGIAVGILAERPDLQAELRASPHQVPSFVEEVLRYESPFRFHPRTATRDLELGGVEIPAGGLVLLLWASANRDGTQFDEPDDLQLDRPRNHLHVGFGRGIHHCVGAALARLEARVVLTRLLERTSSFRLDASAPATWADSIWVHRHDRLPILLETR